MIGTTSGIAVKCNSGRFNYYDGRIEGNTSTIPEVPNQVEYLYEPAEYTDDETGYKYCILEWMRSTEG